MRNTLGREGRGEAAPGVFVLGNRWMPAYLVAAERPLMIDACLSVLGPLYLEDLAGFLGDPHRLQWLFFTHVHFDHCGAGPYLKRKLPGLQLAASEKSAQILARPNAVELIRSLNEDMIRGSVPKTWAEDVRFDGMSLDWTLKDGEEIDLGGGWVLRAVSTPGHTRDMLSYYFPGQKILFASEAAGLKDNYGDISPTFLSDYEDYIASLEKLLRVEADRIFFAHGPPVSGEDAHRYIRKSLAAARLFRQRIERYLDEAHGEEQAVVDRIAGEDYDGRHAALQARRPYTINLQAKVHAVARLAAKKTSAARGG
ncbi:MAG: MBL fold metallo-hydrolase [Deltaproteobacteria bacterium]|nr:MBL fold metallo-hydrolase [Deltaproteobacteria bacterium]